MAEIGISLAEKLIEMVGSEAIRQIRSLRGYESELDHLKETIITIRKVLLDAESKGQLSHEAQHYIQKLQDALYDADDLFDEVCTRAELKQHNKDAKLSEKVSNFFSSTIKTPSVLISMSREVKKIRKKLDGIASNHNTFGFSVDSQPIRERREDTCSYVYSDEVIVGREGDINKVIHRLLDSSLQDRVTFLSIVGIGGLGKTTLAQLVFNDDRVKAAFPLRLWTCVSDENAEDFKVKNILARILGSASDNKHDGLTMDLVHRKLLGFLGGKKYLIVLDDVWNEDLEKWLSFKKFLMSGGEGSRVLVTTRSERTAMVVGERHRYKLRGLSPENSWHLFEITAFGEKDRQDVNYAELITYGKKIVEQCSSVPLAIKVVGRLLYGQNESKWRLFQECGLAKLKDGNNKIMSILKLSYDNLESALKTCFTYCALFPKDFRINKEKLIRLWMAQGYIVPLDVGQSLEDAGEEYISILLRRCFFQDVEKNEIGGVESFKIHDLIHDVAQKVAGKSVVAVSSTQTIFGDEAHHLFHIGSKCKGNIFSKCRIRSYVRDGYEINFPVAELVENWKFLRTLDLHDLDIEALPNSIGKLMHLRYLDLSDNRRLMTLPDSVTKLYNLRTLDLKRCENLKELPKGLAKLANLRHLDISGCNLRHMPSGLDKMNCLCVLTNFVVGRACSIGELENILALKNLRGSFSIKITHEFMGIREYRGGYLKSMSYLEALEIDMEGGENHETLLEKLEPPPSIKQLNLSSYDGAKFPSRWWGAGKVNTWANFLPNLVHFNLYDYHNLLHLPSLSKLPHLKSLSLHSLEKLDYIEDSASNGSSREVFFLPSRNLNFRGWVSCLETLKLNAVNNELWITNFGQENHSIKLREVEVDNLDYLKVLTMEGLISIRISRNDDIESMSQLAETLKGYRSLRSLTIMICRRLRSLEGVGWEHLTALDSLHLMFLSKLTFSVSTKEKDGGNDDDDADNDDDNGDNDDDDDGMPWRFIGGSLRTLVLSILVMKTIPKGIRHLTSLENLTIDRLFHLTSLPKWISCLSSLRSLRIHGCKELQLNVGILRDLTSLQLLEGVRSGDFILFFTGIVCQFPDSLSFSRGSEHGCYILPESNTWQGCQDRATRADVDDINSNASVLDGLNLSLHIHDSNYSGFISIMAGWSAGFMVMVAMDGINSDDTMTAYLVAITRLSTFMIPCLVGSSALWIHGRFAGAFGGLCIELWSRWGGCWKAGFLARGESLGMWLGMEMEEFRPMKLILSRAIIDRQFPGICYHGIDRQFSGRTMAEIGISLAGRLIEVVGSEAIREICSIWGYKSQLDDLKETISTIRKVLLDAESKDQLSQEAQNYIWKLKDAVYDADDLFDEFLTLAKLKQHNKDAKLSEKVRDFFSSKKNTLSVAYSMSQGVKKIRKKLDGIASNHITFGFRVDSQPIRERREETCSYVYSDEVIGRECDLHEVVHMLLDSGSQDRVSFLSIVGVGGLGKTTLTQLVYNDERIKTEFPLRLWTCVSDENAEDFDVKAILTKILESASDAKHDGLTMDLVQRKLLGFLGGKKYLIVLDDVWNEDREKWLALRKFFMGGGAGSRVLVTTRSDRTATVVDEEYKYELNGLSPENSWLLFEMTAFGETERPDVSSSELMKLGKEIVEQCCNVPLAIKVVGTLLYGQNESKWRLFQECGVAKLKDGDNKIMSILKLSYDNLESPLKTCFTYCALFPKDFRINKEKLIRLWMAQGYVVPLDVGQSLEDAGEEYISIFLRRCFFQDVEKNNIGGVESFKIHDLIHDVAQKVAGKGVVGVSSIQANFGDEARHLFHIGSKCKGSIFSKCKIRSYVRDGFDINFQVAELVVNWNLLRTLDLHDLGIKTLPDSIGKLLHLRYLDLSDNRYLAVLPDSVTKLYNLQTLDLKRCKDLKELPKGLAKLANLRHLDTSGCYELRRMPSGLDKLSCLCVLTRFVVDEERSIEELENLLALKNLRGNFEIEINNFMGTVECTGGNLRRMTHLEALKIRITGDGNHETLLEKLEPPLSLKKLELYAYRGANYPSGWWGATFLPNLVDLKLGGENLLHLPSFSKLPHLKSLSLTDMDKLEYIEDSTHNGSSRDKVFFPSLKELEIKWMRELRGWWRGEDIDCNNHVQPCFSRLSKLKITDCKKLASFPACASLEKLKLSDVSKELWITSLGQENDLIRLRGVEVHNLDYLKRLTMEGLTSILISGNHDIESLSQLEETFKGCRSLQSLAIMNCDRLRSLDGIGWKHLTALDSLRLVSLPKLAFSGTTKEDGDDDDDDDDDDEMPWRSIGGRLRSLGLSCLKIQTIPKGIRHLTSLENLTIDSLQHLTSFPEWISWLSSLRSLRITNCRQFQLNVGILQNLTSLKVLEMRYCPSVFGRFRNPDVDWAKLQHIPSVDIRPGGPAFSNRFV
ncbi:uncharacterized protein LOC141613018 [Silene latifolia]|uniref:uncharacterized protein LOC141613018 n=1 Tax=Silene latifolia TaxID=37657 RepID=UPI003D782447